MSKRKSLIGKKFARLTVIGDAESHRSKSGATKTQSVALCDCGVKITVMNDSLMSGNTRSCGCLKREVLPASRRTHGMSRGKTYAAWCGMFTRCLNKKRAGWKNYGGRGISVCARWDSFESFLLDMGENPNGNSLERINNDGNYEPGNCKWATRKEQGRNTRTVIIVTFKGMTGCLSEICEKFCLRYKTVWNRIHVRRWPVEDALTFPIRKRVTSG